MGAEAGSSTNHEIVFNFYVKGGGQQVVTKVGQLVSKLQEGLVNTVDMSPKVSRAWNDMSSSVESAGKAFAQSTIGIGGARSALDEFGDVAFKMNNIMSQTQPVVDLFKQRALAAWEAGTKFGQAIANMQTIMDNPVEGGREMAEVMERILRSTPKEAEDVFEGAYDTLSAGFTKAADAAKILTAANRLAIAGIGEVKEGVDVITSALNAYGLSADRAEEVATSLFVANKIGKSTLSDIADGYGKIIPIAALVNVTVDEVNAAIAVLTQTGLTAAESETNLRMALLSVIKPTKEMTDLIQGLGYQTGDQMLKTEGLRRTLIQLSAATNGNQESFARAFSRVQGLTAATLLGSLRSSEYAAALDETSRAVKSVGTNMSILDAANDAVANSTESLFKRTQAALEALKRDQFDLMEGTVRALLQTTIELSDAWAELGKTNPLGEILKASATMSMVFAAILAGAVYVVAFITGKFMLAVAGLSHMLSSLSLDPLRKGMLGIKDEMNALTKEGEAIQAMATAAVQQELSLEKQKTAELVRQNNLRAKAATDKQINMLKEGFTTGKSNPALLSLMGDINSFNTNSQDKTRRLLDRQNGYDNGKTQFDKLAKSAAASEAAVEKATMRFREGAVSAHRLGIGITAAATSMAAIVEMSLRFVDLDKYGTSESGLLGTLKYLAANPGALTTVAFGISSFVPMAMKAVSSMTALKTVFDQVSKIDMANMVRLNGAVAQSSSIMARLAASMRLMFSGVGAGIVELVRTKDAMGAASLTASALGGGVGKVAIGMKLLIAVPVVLAITTMIRAFQALDGALENHSRSFERAERAKRSYLAAALEPLPEKYSGAAAGMALPERDKVKASTGSLIWSDLTDRFGGAVEKTVQVMSAGAAKIAALQGNIDITGTKTLASMLVLGGKYVESLKKAQDLSVFRGNEEFFKETYEARLNALIEAKELSVEYAQAWKEFVVYGTQTETTADAIQAIVKAQDYEQAKKKINETNGKVVSFFEALGNIFEIDENGAVISTVQKSAEKFAERTDLAEGAVETALKRVLEAGKNISELSKDITAKSSPGEASAAADAIGGWLKELFDSSLLPTGESVLDVNTLSQVRGAIESARETLDQVATEELSSADFAEHEFLSDTLKKAIELFNLSVGPTIMREIDASIIADSILQKLADVDKEVAARYSGLQSLQKQAVDAATQAFNAAKKRREAGVGGVTDADVSDKASAVDAAKMIEVSTRLEMAKKAKKEFEDKLTAETRWADETFIALQTHDATIAALADELATGGGTVADWRNAQTKRQTVTEEMLETINKVADSEEITAKEIREAGSIQKKAFQDFVASGDVGNALQTLDVMVANARAEYAKVAEIHELRAQKADLYGERGAEIAASERLAAAAAKNAGLTAGAKLKAEGLENVFKAGYASGEEAIRLSEMEKSYASISDSLQGMGDSAGAAAANISATNAQLEMMRMDIESLTKAASAAGVSAENKKVFEAQIAQREAAITAYIDKLKYMRSEEDNLLEMIGKRFVNDTRSAGDLMEQMADRGSAAIGEFSDAIVDWANGAKVNFADMARSILADLAKIAARQALMNIIGAAVGSFGATNANTAKYSIPVGGSEYVNPSTGNIGFDTGGFVGNGGRKVQVLAHEGEGIFTPKQMNNADKLFRSMEASRSGGGAKVIVNNYGNSQVEAKQSKDPKTGDDIIEVLVTELEGKMKSRMDRGGGMSPYLESQYGLKRSAGRSL